MDKDLWRDIPGYVGKYKVSSRGEIWSINKNRLLTWKKRGKYFVVELYVDGKGRFNSIHRIVLEAFVGPANGRVARHLDNNPSNNDRHNLKWGTSLDNAKDRIRHGTVKTRSNGHYLAKLTKRDVEHIAVDNRVSSVIAREYGVCSSLIRNIKCGIAC